MKSYYIYDGLNDRLVGRTILKDIVGVVGALLFVAALCYGLLLALLWLLQGAILLTA